MSLAIGREEAIREQPRTAVLELISLLLQIGDATIGGTHAINLIADILRVTPWKNLCGPNGVGMARDENRDQPFILCFAGSRPGNFRTVYDAPLRAGFCAAASLLIAGPSRQEENRFGWVHQHVGTHHDVLVYAQAYVAYGAPNPIRLRQGIDEVSAALPDGIYFMAFRRQNHGRRRETLPIRRLEAPILRFRQAARIFLVDRRTHHVSARHTAHFRTPLHAAVTADRHEASVRATDIALSEL